MGSQSAVQTFYFRRGWIYALTLALVTINYMDRAALGVVAQAVRGEFGLSPVQMGYLFSSFLWTYVIMICLLPIGVMLDRFTALNINSVGIALWSLAMAATAGVWSFGPGWARLSRRSLRCFLLASIVANPIVPS